MATSKITDDVEVAIRAAQTAGDTQAAIVAAFTAGWNARAVTIAADAVRKAAKDVRDRRPGDGALADAELAANLLLTARQLRTHVPSRLPGCPKVPGPDDMLAKFADVLRRNAERKEGDAA
jgi:hypothetical protein